MLPNTPRFTPPQLAGIYIGSSGLIVVGATIICGLGGFCLGLGICGAVYAIRASMNPHD